MAFEKRNLPKEYFKYKECSKGQILCEGHWIKCGEDNYGNPTYEFKNKEDGTIYVLNSSGHLNYLMNEYAVIGDYCRVTYAGTEVAEKGKFKGKDYHTFDLEVDPDQSENPKPVKEKAPETKVDETLEGMTL